MAIRGGSAIWQSADWSADIAYGEDENRFTISRCPHALRHGDLWQVDGTPYAGIVDTVCPVVDASGATTVSYKGRTVQGVLAAKVLDPPAGQSHRTETGDLNSCIADVVSAVGLEGYLEASPEQAGASVSGYRFRRYINAYDGLRMMCASAGYRLEFLSTMGAVRVSAVPADTYGDIPSELVPFSAERTYRPTNHMVGLGSGTGASRQVVDWYADAEGALSQTQTLFGLDEVADTYSASSSDSLSEDTREKLAEAQGQGSVSVSLPAGADLDVGDSVTASAAEAGLSLTAQVTKVTVKIANGVPTVSYTVGEPQWPEEED